MQPKIGDILVSNWGYEQTNVTFYKVVAVTSKTVKINGISAKTGGYDKHYMAGVKYPELDRDGNPILLNGEPLRRRIGDSYRPESGYCIRINSYEFAYPWDGKPVGFTDYH